MYYSLLSIIVIYYCVGTIYNCLTILIYIPIVVKGGIEIGHKSDKKSVLNIKSASFKVRGGKYGGKKRADSKIGGQDNY